MPVFLIDKIQQKNGGEFFLVDAEDIECKDGTSLQEKLDSIEEVTNGSDDYDFIAEFENALIINESSINSTTQS